MSVPAYPEYKDSGVAWLGVVPSHWERKPLFALVYELDDRNQGMQEDNLLSLSYGNIKRKNIDDNDGLLPASFETYQIVKRDDIVWRLTDLQNDQRSLRTGIVRERGIITSAYLATRPIAILPEFLAYLLRAYDLTKVFYSMGGGLRQSMKFSDVKWLPIMLPTEAEQTAIAAFLDRETAKIDALVAEQQRLIALLKEKRQAVISHAVTKGLNPNAPMKDSGIEWLGEIPAHWEAARVKHCCSVKGRIGFRGYTADDLVPEGDGALVLGGTNMAANGSLTLEKRTYLTWNKYEESPEIMIFKGDVIIGQRGTCGNAVYVDRDLGPTTINPSLVVLKRLTVDGQFLTFSINAAHVQSVVDSIVSKTAVPMISQEQIGNMPIALPPAEEQVHITEQLTKRAFDFDNLIGEAQSAITLLQERRAALISAAVTGKIDVRGLAVEAVEVEAA